MPSVFTYDDVIRAERWVLRDVEGDTLVENYVYCKKKYEYCRKNLVYYPAPDDCWSVWAMG